MTSHSKSLNTSLQNVYQTLVSMHLLPEHLPEGQSTSIEQDLLLLKQELEKLNRFNHEILQIGGHEGTHPQQALWKTPDLESKLRNQLEDINKKFTSGK